MAILKVDYFETAEGKEIEQVLRDMVANEAYVTNSSYSPNTQLYTSNSITFVEKHMDYLRKHPKADAQQYISNLKIISKRR